MLDKTAGQGRDALYAAHPGMPAADGYRPSVRALIEVLRRRKLPFLACLVVVPAIAALALHRVTPLYTAVGALIYEPGRYRSQELQSVLQTGPTTEAVMASQAEVLHGLRLIEPMAQRLDLFSNPEFNASLRRPSMVQRLLARVALLRAPPSRDDAASGPPVSSPRNQVLLAAQRAVTVRPLNNSHVMEVTFTASDPALTAAAVNTLMDIYVKAGLAAKYSAVDKARAWLERRAAELRSELRKQEDRIASYRADNGLVQGVHAELDVENISQLEEALAKARADLANALGKLNAAQNGGGGEAPLAPSVIQLREQGASLAAQLQEMSTRLGPRHPDVLGVQRELRAVQSQEAAETARVVAATQAEVRAAQDRVQALEKDLAASHARVDESAVAQVPLSLMQRDADALRGLLTGVLQSLQETGQQAAVEMPDAHEVSLAPPPQNPSYPRAGPILAGSVASGLMLGLFFVYLLEINDTTIASGEDVRMALRVPCFALVPNLGRRVLGRMRAEDYAALRPLGGFAEQMRGLRTGLWLGAARPRTVSITAARPGEGKTTVALALGRVAALSGERVMLLDCDLRRPSIGRLLGGDGEQGLAEVLSGAAELEAVIKKDPLTPMSYMPAGATGPGAVGLFMSGKMAELIGALRDEYDLVVMDAPPALAVSDTRLIAHLADATLFCARWRHTPREVARNAIALLEDADASVVGVALTRVDARVHWRSGYPDADACGPRLGGYFQA